MIPSFRTFAFTAVVSTARTQNYYSKLLLTNLQACAMIMSTEPATPRFASAKMRNPAGLFIFSGREKCIIIQKTSCR